MINSSEKCGACVKHEQNYLKCMRSKGGKGNTEKYYQREESFVSVNFLIF